MVLRSYSRLALSLARFLIFFYVSDYATALRLVAFSKCSLMLGLLIVNWLTNCYFRINVVGPIRLKDLVERDVFFYNCLFLIIVRIGL